MLLNYSEPFEKKRNLKVIQWEKLARSALRGALEIRKRVGLRKSDPVCIYDLAEKLGLKVRFLGGNSFGGMYSKTSSTILVPTLRPPGRQAFTCAHEVGHWYFGHGNRIDELKHIENNSVNNHDERLVNIFAGYLLMTPWAVREAFDERSWQMAQCTPIQAYAVANQLGVGYETLIQHLVWSLGLISTTHADKLLRTKPNNLRELILGFKCDGHLIIVDKNWYGVPIDLRVDDLLLFSSDINVEGNSLKKISDQMQGQVVKAISPGISRAESIDESWACYIRVSRKDYEGLNQYRHLEDPDYE